MKPSLNSVTDYLMDFVFELRQLLKNGFIYNGKHITITVKSFLCDAPARSFLKGITSHNGYDSCERCSIHGTWTEGRVVFNEEIVYPPRDNGIYRSFGYKGHQKEISPLIEIGLNVIEMFPLDYMHLVCLGTVRRLLHFLKNGPCGKISACQISEVSTLLLTFNAYMPSEFARRPRGLQDMDRWKATEFRQFILYTGPVVFRSILSDTAYNHFLALSVSVSILLQNNDKIRLQYLEYARELIKHFVYYCKYIYGPSFTVYNIHHLLHLPDDCLYYNCSLDLISCFKYENFLQRLKKSIRNSANPIVQVAKRQAEFQNAFISLPKKTLFTKISNRRKDNCFFIQGNDVAFVKEYIDSDSFLCDVVKTRYLDNFYDFPMNSLELNIAIFPNRNKRKLKRKILQKDDFLRKCVCLPEQRGFAIFPLLHEIERV